MKSYILFLAFVSSTAFAFERQPTLYKNTKEETPGYLVFSPQGQGFTAHGLYSKYNNPGTSFYWEATCKQIDDTTLKCIYSHKSGNVNSGDITFTKSSDTQITAEVTGDDGHKSNPTYDLIFPTRSES
tara:strand:+ start:6185 stop:6568 length:384 start_codon:yes stop_codon:yes gene_type:complete